MGKYWAEACEVVGRPGAGHRRAVRRRRRRSPPTPRVGTELLAEAFAERTAEEWRERLQGFSGQWAMVQDVLEAAADPQAVANGYVQDYEDVDGNPYQLASPPVQFGGVPATPKRAPGFNEHGDEILESTRHRLGHDRGPQGPRRRGMRRQPRDPDARSTASSSRPTSRRHVRERQPGHRGGHRRRRRRLGRRHAARHRRRPPGLRRDRLVDRPRASASTASSSCRRASRPSARSCASS